MKTGLRQHWPLALLAVVVVALFAVFMFAPAASTVRDTAWILLTGIPLVAFLLQYAYAHVPRWRLRVNRWRLLLTNPESSWGLTVDLDVENAKTGAAAANEAIAAVKSSRQLASDPHVTVWTVNDTTVRITSESDTDMLGDDRDHVQVEVPTVRRAFRGLDGAIQTELAPILQRIEQAVQPTHAKYVVRIQFPKVNPYFGLFVADLAPEAVSRFDIECFETDATDEVDVVSVKRDRIELVASSLLAAQRLSLHYLSLQPMKKV
jgi:hypothetical protein